MGHGGMSRTGVAGECARNCPTQAKTGLEWATRPIARYGVISNARPPTFFVAPLVVPNKLPPYRARFV